MIFDTHAHYDAAQYNEDREEVLVHLKDQGVAHVVNISNGWEDLQKTLTLVETYPFMYGTVGIHPCEIKDLSDERLQRIREYAKKDRIVAIGEIGLDFYWVKEVEERDRQRYWFVRQLELAKEVDLPVVIHSREAAQETFDTMKRVHAATTGGVIHCYSGSYEMAKEYVKMGYYLGIGGVVTYKNAKTLKQVAAKIPLEHLVLETDAPYLSPVPYRGKRNSSAYLRYVVSEIAALKGISPEEVEDTTYNNALKLYRLTKDTVHL